MVRATLKFVDVSRFSVYEYSAWPSHVSNQVDLVSGWVGNALVGSEEFIAAPRV